MIPVCEPTLIGEELEYVMNCIKTNWISSKGQYIEQFEKIFSKFCGAKHGITTTNGTTALHLPFEALGMGKGDEVIVPTLTMAASAFAVVYTGATPVFVDCRQDTWNIDVDKIEEKITEKTKAIMPVHIYGHPVDMDPLFEVAEKHGLHVIEDAAEAHGAEYKGKRVGCLGTAGCFSFYANKIITTGEGGMVLTNDDELADKMRALKDLAHSKELRFSHKKIGFNYRMTNLQAAIGVAQMKNINKLMEMRRKNARLYNSLLSQIEGIVLPVEKKWVKNVYWMYAILLEDSFGIGRDKFMKKLGEKGIGTRTFFIPMHQQPVFMKMGIGDGYYPIADYVSKRGLYLPSSSSLTEDQIRFIVETIQELAC